ncbi:MAG: sigma-70 family RNA polymerase sigma factor [Planctomycetes bacterium]|nr:sigma-70 family RNA polymerase sigma factor [Planctomycetota bacterium]
MWRSRAIPRALQLAYEDARENHPRIDVKFSDWHDRVRLLLTRRAGREDSALFEALVAATYTSDLYLAIGCDLGHADAWTRLLELYESQLADRAASLTVGLPKRERFVADFLAAIFRETKNDGPFATRIGTYDGSASLRTWLLVELHDKALRARQRLESVHHSGTREAVRRNQSTDSGALIATAMREAWDAVPNDIRLVLALHVGDRLQASTIASITRQSISRVRNKLQFGLESIRGHVQQHLEGHIPPQFFVDIQMWFEHALDALLRSARPRPPQHLGIPEAASGQRGGRP